jgi:hypothetical protein
MANSQFTVKINRTRIAKDYLYLIKLISQTLVVLKIGGKFPNFQAIISKIAYQSTQGSPGEFYAYKTGHSGLPRHLFCSFVFAHFLYTLHTTNK